MWDWVRILAWSVGSELKSQRDLALENVALRHQLMVPQRQSGRPRLKDRDRRRILHFSVTTSPSARWAAQQVREAFPYATAPRFLLRDRDSIFGHDFVRCVGSMGIEEVVTAPASPWQHPYCERLIGSIRRECLDHVIILNERHLMRVLCSYASYCHSARTHRSLDDDCPDPRVVELPEMGNVVAIAQVGGLHHRYTRRLAA